MKSCFATFGLAVGVVSAASAQLASPASGAGAPASSTSVAAAPPETQASAERGQPDPYAPLWQCRRFVREYLSLSSQARPRRLEALEACIAETERNPEVEVAGP